MKRLTTIERQERQTLRFPRSTSTRAGGEKMVSGGGVFARKQAENTGSSLLLLKRKRELQKWTFRVPVPPPPFRRSRNFFQSSEGKEEEKGATRSREGKETRV